MDEFTVGTLFLNKDIYTTVERLVKSKENK